MTALVWVPRQSYVGQGLQVSDQWGMYRLKRGVPKGQECAKYHCRGVQGDRQCGGLGGEAVRQGAL